MTDQPVRYSDKFVNRIRQYSVGITFALLSVLALTSLALLLFGRTEHRLWLFLTVPGALLSAYLLLPLDGRNQFHDWLLNHVFAITTVTALWAIMVALMLWAIVNFSWQPQYDRLQSATLLNEKGLYVTTVLPGGILANGQAHPIHFRLTNTTDVTKTVTTTLQLPATTSLLSITNAQNSGDIAPHQTLTRTLLLAMLTPPEGIRQAETVTVTAFSDVSASSPTTTALYVEGIRGESLRQFVTATVDKASPLIIIVAFFIPILSTIVPKYLETYQAQKEADLQKALEAKRRPDKRRAKEMRDQVRSYLHAGEIERATVVMKTWQRYEKYRQFYAAEAQIGQSLLRLARLEDTEKITLQIQNGRAWPNACIGAFVAAQQQCRQHQHMLECWENLQRARHLLPVTQAAPDIRDRLARTAVEFIAYKKEQHDFTLIKNWPSPPHYLTGKEITLPYIQKHILGGLNPFTHERAEEDRYYLFRGRRDIAFWGGHPLFNELFTIDQSTLIFGESGSGLTTLAYALHYYAPRREALALFIPGTPQPDEIRQRFTAHILDFVLTYPTYLQLLTTAERAVIAQLMAQNMGKIAVRARIEAKQADLYSLATPLEEDEQSVSGEQLQLLAKAVDAAARRTPPSWANEVTAAAHALKFNRAILVLDVPETAVTWLKNTILPNLSTWQAAGLHTVIFLPDSVQEQIVEHSSAHLYYRHLTWRNNSFCKMLDWRYKAFAGRVHKLANQFDNGAFDYMIDHCRNETGSYNPRRFIQLWQAIVVKLSADSEATIPQSLVEQVIQGIPLPPDTVVAGDIPMSIDAVSEITTSARPIASVAIPDLTERLTNKPVQLRKILDSYFNLSELSNLCFDLGADYEEFSDKKSEMIREIISYFERHNRFNELWEEVRRLRPNAFRDETS